MKKNIENKKYSGFTFAELIITIAIVGIMTVVAIVSMNPSKTQAKLKAAQTEVASSIKQAQSYALQGKKQGAITPQYYGIKFTNSTNYELYCNTSIVETYKLKDGVVLSGALPSGITFSIPDGNSNLLSSLILTFGFNDTAKSITISPSGSITEDN